MGFNRTMFSKKITDLSSGEKMKLKLNELILGDFNFLILDEPTNNLDMQNKIFLERVLNGYNGNLILVSHDKTLIDNVCNKNVIIENETINIQ
jgi:macrolide transport system ATP-binding/permease protein